MNITLTHPFIKTCFDIKELFRDVNKMSTFCTRLDRQSNTNPLLYKPDDYKGDGLELFAEALIRLSPADNRIAIFDYQIVDKGSDTGVDGFGKGIDGKPSCVQVKFRSDVNTTLTANEDHLSNFVSSAYIHHDVDPKSNTSLLVITTAQGLHYYTDENMFKNKVRCLGYQQLRELVDNNFGFWNNVRILINEATTPSN